MAELNARCDNCGTIFPSGMNFGPNANIGSGMVRMTVGPCPNCGGDGRTIVDGIPFSVSGGQVIVPNGRLSASDLAIIMTTLSPFQSGERSKKATQQAIAKVLPDLAPEINKLTEGQLAILLASIFAVLAMFQNQLNSDGASVQGEQIIQLIREQTAAIRQQTDQAQKESDRSFQLDQERNDLLRQQSKLLEEHLKKTPKQHEAPHPQQEPGGK